MYLLLDGVTGAIQAIAIREQCNTSVNTGYFSRPDTAIAGQACEVRRCVRNLNPVALGNLAAMHLGMLRAPNAKLVSQRLQRSGNQRKSCAPSNTDAPEDVAKRESNCS